MSRYLLLPNETAASISRLHSSINGEYGRLAEGRSRPHRRSGLEGVVRSTCVVSGRSAGRNAQGVTVSTSSRFREDLNFT